MKGWLCLVGWYLAVSYPSFRMETTKQPRISDIAIYTPTGHYTAPHRLANLVHTSAVDRFLNKLKIKRT
jgi:hypothetical protein